MALVEVAFLSPRSGVLDSGQASSVEQITSTASNQVTTGQAGGGEAAVVTVSGGNVYVSFGTSPNASTDASKRLVVDGSTRAFDLVSGFKVATVNA